MEAAALDRLISVVTLLAADLPHDVVLLCGVEGKLRASQFGTAKFSQALLDAAVGVFEDCGDQAQMLESRLDDREGSIAAAEDDKSDDDELNEYDDIADIIDEYDNEPLEGDKIDGLLGSLISDTEKVLELLDDLPNGDPCSSAAASFLTAQQSVSSVSSLSSGLAALEETNSVPPQRSDIGTRVKAMKEQSQSSVRRGHDEPAGLGISLVTENFEAIALSDHLVNDDSQDNEIMCKTSVKAGELAPTTNCVSAGKGSSKTSEDPKPIVEANPNRRAVLDMTSFKECREPSKDAKTEGGLSQEGPSFLRQTGDLVSTPLLTSYGLVFNKKYKLFICKSCCVGLPFCSITTHLADTIVKQWNDDDFEPGLKLCHAAHPILVGVSTKKEKAVFRAALLKSLQDADVISSDSEVFSSSSQVAWREYASNIVKPWKAVQGIRAHKGRVCGDCTFSVRTERGLREHQKQTGHDKPSRIFFVQTLSESWPLFFPIRANPIREAPSSKEFACVSPLALLSAEKSQAFQGITTATLTPNQRTLLPILSGTTELWLGHFNRKNLHSILPDIPKAPSQKPSSLYAKLRGAVFRLFGEDLQLLSSGSIHHEVAHHITNGSWTRRDRRDFLPLTLKSSVREYATVEFELLWTLLKFSSRQANSSNCEASSAELFELSLTHRAALMNLQNALSKNNHKRKVDAALRSLYNALYFPEGEDRSKAKRGPIPAFPLLQYVTYSFLGKDGLYLPVHQIPPILAKHQYCVRLRAYHCISKLIDDDTLPDWISISKSFCDRHLNDWGATPFATIRHWMHHLSVISRKTPRPNLVWWRGDVILMFAREISFPEYRDKVFLKVLQLERFLIEDVLCGTFTMAEMEDLFKLNNIEDMGDETSYGYGVIADASEKGLDNNQSNMLFERLWKNSSLGFKTTPTGRLALDTSKGLQWIANIHRAWTIFFPVSHITTISGRASEAVFLRPVNNEDGRRGVVFDPGARTGAYDADYHKGLAIQGVNKHIRRYMPYQIWRILYILVRMVRPIELLVLRMTAISEAQAAVTLEAYRNHVFASLGKAWSATDMSKALSCLFKEITGSPMGIHDYRHLSIAIQRKYISPRPTPGPLELSLNRMVGHEKAVGDAIYARLHSLGTCPPDERERALMIGREYHSLMGFATGFGDQLPPSSQLILDEFSATGQRIEMPVIRNQRKLKGKHKAVSETVATEEGRQRRYGLRAKKHTEPYKDAPDLPSDISDSE